MEPAGLRVGVNVVASLARNRLPDLCSYASDRRGDGQRDKRAGSGEREAEGEAEGTPRAGRAV